MIYITYYPAKIEKKYKWCICICGTKSYDDETLKIF